MKYKYVELNINTSKGVSKIIVYILPNETDVSTDEIFVRVINLIIQLLTREGIPYNYISKYINANEEALIFSIEHQMRNIRHLNIS